MSDTKSDPKLDVSDLPAQKLDVSATSNISNELDEILGRPHEMMTSWQIEALVKAKQALTAYIQQECDRTALAESEGIMNCWEHPSLAPYFLTDRIAQLEAKLKDLNQGGEA